MIIALIIGAASVVICFAAVTVASDADDAERKYWREKDE